MRVHSGASRLKYSRCESVMRLPGGRWTHAEVRPTMGGTRMRMAMTPGRLFNNAAADAHFGGRPSARPSNPAVKKRTALDASNPRNSDGQIGRPAFRYSRWTTAARTINSRYHDLQNRRRNRRHSGHEKGNDGRERSDEDGEGQRQESIRQQRPARTWGGTRFPVRLHGKAWAKESPSARNTALRVNFCVVPGMGGIPIKGRIPFPSSNSGPAWGTRTWPRIFRPARSATGISAPFP